MSASVRNSRELRSMCNGHPRAARAQLSSAHSSNTYSAWRIPLGQAQEFAKDGVNANATMETKCMYRLRAAAAFVRDRVRASCMRFDGYSLFVTLRRTRSDEIRPPKQIGALEMERSTLAAGKREAI